MRATPNLDFAVVKPEDQSLKNFVSMLRKVYESLTNVVNGNVGLGDGTNADNINGAWINVVAPGTPNTNFTVTHNLGRLPVGYWVMQKDRACDVFTGTIAATKTQLTLQASVASAVLRLFVVGILLFAFCLSTQAQTTNLTITVIDSGGQTWSNGTWSVVLVTPPGVVPFGPPFNLIGGGPVPNQKQSGALDSSGTATMTLTQNASILPSQSQWKFQVCSQATASNGCFTQYTTVTATTTLAITPPAIIVNAGPNARAYSDNEVVAGVGQTYYNFVSHQLRACDVSDGNNCSVWVNAGNGSTPPGGSPIQTQVNNGGVFGGTPCESFANLSTGPENADCDWHSKGPNPYIDVTRYGVRALVPTSTPARAGLTATITNGTNIATISNSSCPAQVNSVCFQNGDGVVIYGAGAACSLTTPVGVTVTPSIAAAGMGTGIVVSGPVGATTYNYQVVARDKAGCVTAASAVASTTTGAATLGKNTVSITSMSRSGAVVTATTASAHGLAVGAEIYIEGTSDDIDFGSFQVVGTVPDNTHFTFTNGVSTVYGGPASATGGTVLWHNVNHVTWTQVTGAWEYCVYGRTGGSLTWIGCSRPSGANITDLTFDDFGSPEMDNFRRPGIIPNTPPVSQTSDSLVTTITSGAGTTTLTLAANASTTVVGATIRFDNAPNILTAANLASNTTNGMLHFPATTNGNYVVNSYLILPNRLSVSFTTGLTLFDTIELSFGPYWTGDIFPQGYTFPSFSTTGGAQIIVDEAYPGIYFANSPGYFKRLQFNQAAVLNGALLMIGDSVGPITFDNVIFSSSSSTSGYMDVGLIYRGISNSSSFQNLFHNVEFTGGGNQANGAGSTMTPVFICSSCGTTRMENIALGIRGMFWSANQSGSFLQVNTGRTQGPIMPVLSLYPVGSESVIIDHFELDTPSGASPLVANLLGNASARMTNIGSALGVPTFSGAALTSIFLANSSIDTSLLGQNHEIFSAALGTTTNNGLAPQNGFGANSTGVTEVSTFTHFTPGPARLYWDIGVPVVTAVVAAGGSVPVGTHSYGVCSFGFDGGCGQQGKTICTTTTGNQTCNLSWNAVPSAKGYNIYRDNTLISGVGPPTVNSPTTTFSDTAAGLSGNSAGTTSGSGQVYLSSAEIGAPQFRYVGGTSGFSLTTTNVSLTANRTDTWPDASGMVVVSSYLNSVYDNFNRANGSIGSNWTVVNGSLNVSSNTVVGATGAVPNVAGWATASSFHSNQFAQATVSSINTCGVAARVSASALTTYVYWVDGPNREIAKYINGSLNSLATVAGNFATGDLIRLEISGNNLTAFRNGAVDITATDSQILSGQPGLVCFGNGAASLDNWSGGNLHPTAQLDQEQDWTQPQHFTQPVTVGATNPVAGSLPSGSFTAGSFYNPNLLCSNISPTFVSGFNSGSVSQANGTCSFQITVGTGAATSTGTISLSPAAAHGWTCTLTNYTRAAFIAPTSTTTTAVVFTNYGTTFTATNFTNSDVLFGSCFGE